MLDVLDECWMDVGWSFAQPPTRIQHCCIQHKQKFSELFMMAVNQLAHLVVISELVESDDEDETQKRGTTRKWIKRRGSHGYFNNIVQELMIEDLAGFRNMFRMTHSDFENILGYIEQEITPQIISGGTRPVFAQEMVPFERFYFEKTFEFS